MMDFLVMTALAAVLSYGAVSAYDQPYQKLEAALSSSADRLPSSRYGARVDADPFATRSGQSLRFALPKHASAETAVLAGVPQFSLEH